MQILYFQKENYESTPSVCVLLKTILKSRVIILRAASSDSVTLTLDCDADEETLTESTGFNLCTAPVEPPWSYEKLKHFAAQLRYVQYDMLKEDWTYQGLKNCDIDGFLHIFDVGVHVSMYLNMCIVVVCRKLKCCKNYSKG